MHRGIQSPRWRETPISHLSSRRQGGWLLGALGPMALVGFALGGARDGRARLPPTPAGVPTAGVPVSGMLAAIGHFRAAQTTGPSQAQALQLTIGRTIGHGLVQPAVQATTASGSARTQAPSRPSIAATCAPSNPVRVPGFDSTAGQAMGSIAAAIRAPAGARRPAGHEVQLARAARRFSPLQTGQTAQARPIKPLQMQVAEVQELLFLPLSADTDQAISELHKHHRKARQAIPDFVLAEEREAFKARGEAAALVALLPAQVTHAMMGGDLGVSQVPCAERRARMLTNMLLERAGAEGDRLAGLRTLLRHIREYAVRHYGARTSQEADSRCFPMSSALAHEIVSVEHERATTSAAGSRGGRSVGNGVVIRWCSAELPN